MKQNYQKYLSFVSFALISILLISCSMVDDKIDTLEGQSKLYKEEINKEYEKSEIKEAVLLFIDEESIDGGNEPNDFSEREINEDKSEIGLREVLPYFKNNVGKQIALYTGQVGDEGWFAPTFIPSTWANAGPSGNGAFNYLFGPGYGLGSNGNDSYLDKTPGVVPLRATGLAMLTGHTVYAVVYDSDISINYDPLNANLKGENLGVVALTVLEVVERKDASSSSLPAVIVRIESAAEVFTYPHKLFSNAPVPHSSSEPMDITPPANYPAPVFKEAT